MNENDGVAAQTPTKDKSLSFFKAKWPKDVADRGFVAPPKCIFTCMPELGITPQEAAVLTNILDNYWYVGDTLYPSIKTLEANLGRSNSGIRAITKSLAKKGFIKKKPRYNNSNIYDLVGPTSKKISEHLPNCRHYAKKLAHERQKTSSLESQDSSDYKDSNILRNINLDSNIKRQDSHAENPDTQDFDIGDNTDSSGKCLKHSWKSFTVDKGANKKGNDIYWTYWRCDVCGFTFHKVTDEFGNVL